MSRSLFASHHHHLQPLLLGGRDWGEAAGRAGEGWGWEDGAGDSRNWRSGEDQQVEPVLQVGRGVGVAAAEVDTHKENEKQLP